VRIGRRKRLPHQSTGENWQAEAPAPPVHGENWQAEAPAPPVHGENWQAEAPAPRVHGENWQAEAPAPPAVSNAGPLLLIEPQQHAPPFHQNRPLDQVGIRRHELEGFIARRRLLTHAAFAIEFVPRIQKGEVVAFTDQLIQLGGGKSLA
jgi:hypothetical protein